MAETRMVTVVPSPRLSETEFIPGVSPEGTEMPVDEAKVLLDAGLVIIKPEEKPALAKEK